MSNEIFDGTQSSDVKDGANFQLAAVQSHRLLNQLFHGSLFTAVLLFGAVIANTFNLNTIWVTFFCENAAALILLGAGLRSAYDVAEWRRKQAGLASIPPIKAARWFIAFVASPWTPRETEKPDRIDRWTGIAFSAGRSFLSRIGLRPLWVASLSLFACLLIYGSWNLQLEPAPIGTSALLMIALCLTFSFLLLVTERRFAAIDAVEWPEAGALSQLARFPILILVASCLCLFLNARGSGLSVWLLAALGGFITLVGLEFFLRATLSMFRPQNHSHEPPLLTESILVGAINWPPRPLTRIQSELRTKLGIDLRQIWAFSFIRKTAPAIVLATFVLGWMLTGIHEIPMSGRGIYEQFGRPGTILQPGLHIGLPWPFGRIIPVENGIVHELATSFSTAGQDEQLADAEGPAPESANRLWDASHVSEKSQIIAGGTDGKQSFQLVNMDIRFVYRIGLSDQAAMSAAYQTANIPTLIESTANRVLVHDFAARTLDGVLGKERLSLANDISSAIQADMNALNSGVEILAVVVEAIHPPAGASSAYHGVQAAQITAQALVARERGKAAEQANDAQMNASLQRDGAMAAAREGVAASEVTKLRFDAERSAYRTAGQVFLTEEYFNRLTTGLSRSKALILDHRIGGSSAPTLDLRSFMSPVDPGTGAEPYTPYQSEETSP
ncbi:protease modulator HflK [Rhizobium mongolense]|uniref:protease modulator HflK n=1 Tax=Rhizobium mongolense TaxID=57676 RepID=UPI003557B0DF